MNKERPILFSGPMVRPILNMKPGVWPPEAIDPSKPIKYQTRRICKTKDVNGKPLSEYTGDALDALIRQYCPHGVPGDRLWVRETWGVGTRPCPIEGWVDGIEYRADEVYIEDERDSLPLYDVETPDNICLDDYSGKGWRPSIHMFRWASRINLEIMNIRVEKVQDISGEDAIAEGVGIFHQVTEDGEDGFYHVPWNKGVGYLQCDSPEEAFMALWDSINEKRGYEWDKNPEVWVEEFKVI